MDHRCLYGHRVPSTFTFAIQNRSCPTCGAPTVTLHGYQAARKIATETGLDAVAAFHAIRVIEAEWVLSPAAAPAALGADPVAPPPLAPDAPTSADEEVVVVDDVVDVTSPPAAAVAPRSPVPAAAPEPRAAKADKAIARPEPRVVSSASPRATAPAVAGGPGFGQEEEDFFKGA